MHLSIYKIIKKLGYDEIRMSKNKLTLAQFIYPKELREDNKHSSFIFKPAKHW